MRRHDLDVVSLVFGLVFAMVAVLWPLWQVDLLDSDSLSWLPALALVLIGLVGVTLSITRNRRPVEELEARALEDEAREDGALEDEERSTYG